MDLGCGNFIAQICGFGAWLIAPVLSAVYGSLVVQNWSRVLSNWFGASQIGLMLLKLVELCKIIMPCQYLYSLLAQLAEHLCYYTKMWVQIPHRLQFNVDPYVTEGVPNWRLELC